MENARINRAYLETLPFSGLLQLADEYGIDVPENLNRRFLIGDILEVMEESEKSPDEPEMIISETAAPEAERGQLPRAYNSTEVEIMLRNPVWAFLYWNISEADQLSLSRHPERTTMLRVSSFSEKDLQKPDDSFDIQISGGDNERYVLLPPGKRYFRADLISAAGESAKILASSKIFEMPHGSRLLTEMRPGRLPALSPVMELSGMRDLLLEHYKNHRESFSVGGD